MHTLAAIDLNLVVSLHALLEERSVTAAARRVGLSQPAMSHALARLRDHFDDPLLIRSGRAMQPTARALQLLDLARPIVASLEVLLSTAPFRPETLASQMRLVTDDQIGVTVVPRLVARLRELAPDLELEVFARGPPGRKAMLRRGTVDLAIGEFSEAGMDLHRSLLFEDAWCCVLRRGHPATKGLTAEAWAELSHLIVSPTGGRRGAVDTVLEARGLNRRVPLVVPHFATALAVVAATDVVLTTARRFVSGRAEGLVVLPPPIEMPAIPVSMLWHPRTEHDPAQRWFRSVVAEIAG